MHTLDTVPYALVPRFAIAPGEIRRARAMNADALSATSIGPRDAPAARSTPIADPRTPVPDPAWQLQPDELHVWFGRMAVSAAIPDASARLLSPDERERASRYRSPLDGSRFALCRSALRVLLGRYVHTAPHALAFSYGAHGKPQLNAGDTTLPICFNIAHCGVVAVYAFALRHDVGVDVERDRTLSDLEPLVRQVLSPREQAALAGLYPAAKQRTFWRCWTQKEALTKALGVGLSMPLTAVEVAARPGLPAGIIEMADTWGDARAWHCHEITIRRHVAMVVVRAHGLRLTVRALDEAPHGAIALLQR